MVFLAPFGSQETDVKWDVWCDRIEIARTIPHNLRARIVYAQRNSDHWRPDQGREVGTELGGE
jgi:hypothetical protein